jgi:hypothetical protein
MDLVGTDGVVIDGLGLSAGVSESKMFVLLFCALIVFAYPFPAWVSRAGLNPRVPSYVINDESKWESATLEHIPPLRQKLLDLCPCLRLLFFSLILAGREVLQYSCKKSFNGGELAALGRDLEVELREPGDTGFRLNNLAIHVFF